MTTATTQVIVTAEVRTGDEILYDNLMGAPVSETVTADAERLPDGWFRIHTFWGSLDFPADTPQAIAARAA